MPGGLKPLFAFRIVYTIVALIKYPAVIAAKSGCAIFWSYLSILYQSFRSFNRVINSPFSMPGKFLTCHDINRKA